MLIINIITIDNQVSKKIMESEISIKQKETKTLIEEIQDLSIQIHDQYDELTKEDAINRYLRAENTQLITASQTQLQQLNKGVSHQQLNQINRTLRDALKIFLDEGCIAHILNTSKHSKIQKLSPLMDQLKQKKISLKTLKILDQEKKIIKLQVKTDELKKNLANHINNEQVIITDLENRIQQLEGLPKGVDHNIITQVQPQLDQVQTQLTVKEKDNNTQPKNHNNTATKDGSGKYIAEGILLGGASIFVVKHVIKQQENKKK